MSLKLDPSGNLLRSFVALNNQVLDRFAPEERVRIGVHVCPGGDHDSTHSADIDYAALLPDLFQLNVGRFYLQMASEPDRKRILRIVARLLGPSHLVFIGVIDPIHPVVEAVAQVRDRVLKQLPFYPSSNSELRMTVGSLLSPTTPPLAATSHSTRSRQGSKARSWPPANSACERSSVSPCLLRKQLCFRLEIILQRVGKVERWNASMLRLFVSCLILTTVSAGGAQVPATAGAATRINPSLNRRIEVLIRSQFSVPPEYDMTLGEKTKSDTTDYDNLPVTFTHEDKKITVNFLISKVAARSNGFRSSTSTPTLPSQLMLISGRSAGALSPKWKSSTSTISSAPIAGCSTAKSCPRPSTTTRATSRSFTGFSAENASLGHARGSRCQLPRQSQRLSLLGLCRLRAQSWTRHRRCPARRRQVVRGPRQYRADYGHQNKVNQTELAMCLSKQDESLVNQSLKLGNSLGVNGTPQVFVDGERLPSGAPRVSELWPAIDRALKAQGIQPPPEKAPETAPSSK